MRQRIQLNICEKIHNNLYCLTYTADKNLKHLKCTRFNIRHLHQNRLQKHTYNLAKNMYQDMSGQMVIKINKYEVYRIYWRWYNTAVYEAVYIVWLRICNQYQNIYLLWWPITSPILCKAFNSFCIYNSRCL